MIVHILCLPLLALLLALASLTATTQALTETEIITRNVRCNFPGVVINRSGRDLIVQYDDKHGAKNITLQTGHNTTETTCDADFIYPIDYNLVTLNVIGQKKGFFNVTSGDVFKMDAYTYDCITDPASNSTVLCGSQYNGNMP